MPAPWDSFSLVVPPQAFPKSVRAPELIQDGLVECPVVPGFPGPEGLHDGADCPGKGQQAQIARHALQRVGGQEGALQVAVGQRGPSLRRLSS